jgi:hypothetical protein
MKRLFVAIACLALASPVFASKTRRVPVQRPASPLAPVTATIAGSPLTIVVGNDTSTQVYDSNLPSGTVGQFFPPDCGAGETADNGIFAGLGGVVYGPDFDNHPCGSAANTYTPWTPVSFSGVTGTGTTADPFKVVIVVQAGATAVLLTETLTYVNGAEGSNISLAFSLAAGAPASPAGGNVLNVLQAADLYLADNDSGLGLLQGGSVGGRAVDNNCSPLAYPNLIPGPTPPSAWSATGYGSIWDQVSADSLGDNVDSTVCEDNGAALLWANQTIPVTIDTGVTFAGSAVPLGATVPALSPKALASLVLLLAAVGYVLARKASPGA